MPTPASRQAGRQPRLCLGPAPGPGAGAAPVLGRLSAASGRTTCRPVGEAAVRWPLGGRQARNRSRRLDHASACRGRGHAPTNLAPRPRRRGHPGVCTPVPAVLNVRTRSTGGLRGAVPGRPRPTPPSPRAPRQLPAAVSSGGARGGAKAPRSAPLRAQDAEGGARGPSFSRKQAHQDGGGQAPH